MSLSNPVGRCALTALVALLAGCQPADGPGQASNAPAAVSAPTAVGETAPSPAPAVAAVALEEVDVAMIQGGAKLEAALLACQLVPRAQADQSTAELRAKYVARGHDGAAFDRVHGEALAQATDKFNDASAPQRAQACEQLKSFGAEADQMAKGMLEQQPKQP